MIRETLLNIVMLAENGQRIIKAEVKPGIGTRNGRFFLPS